MAQTLLCVAIPVILGGKAKQGKVEGDMEYEVNNMVPGIIMTIIRFAITFCIYIGFSCVIYSIFELQHPKGPEYTPPISVTMQCVINLTVQFFVVYLLVWICLTVKECIGWDWWILQNAMEEAKGTCAFCPMLAILFVGVRMRALRLTNNRGAPQGWVQDGMYMATWALLIQFFMVLLIPVATFIMTGGEQVQHAKVDKHGNTRFDHADERHKASMAGKILLFLVDIVRWLAF